MPAHHRTPTWSTTSRPSCERHRWARTDDDRWSCADCAETTDPCLHCGRPLDATALAVCTRCWERGRRLVLDVVDDMARFPFTFLELTGLRSPRYDVARASSSDDDLRLPFGMDALVEDPTDTRIAAAKAPGSALDVLRSWARAWADVRGEELPWDWETYLAERTLWAMQNPGDSQWSTYSEEARQVRSTVRRLLGITPVRAGIPCPDCGGATVQEWRPRADRTPVSERQRVRRRTGTPVEGLDDVVRCTRCLRSWDSTAHQAIDALASWQDMPRYRPDALLTFGELVLALQGRTPKHTIGTWIHRGELLAVHGPWPRTESRARRRRDGTTERLYRFGDADLLASWVEAKLEESARRKAAEAARREEAERAREASDVASSS